MNTFIIRKTTISNKPELPFNHAVRRELFILDADEQPLDVQMATIAQARSIEVSIKYQTTTTVTRNELQEQVKKLYI